MTKSMCFGVHLIFFHNGHLPNMRLLEKRQSPREIRTCGLPIARQRYLPLRHGYRIEDSWNVEYKRRCRIINRFLRHVLRSTALRLFDFSRTVKLFFPNFSSVSKGPPSSFSIFCNWMYVNKSQRVPPFTFSSLCGIFRKKKSFKNVLLFLSLRYSADFRRSRLVYSNKTRIDWKAFDNASYKAECD